MIEESQIERWFSVPELSETQVQAYREIVAAARVYVVTLNRWMPDGEDKNMLVNQIRQEILTAELAIRYRGAQSVIRLVQ